MFILKDGALNWVPKTLSMVGTGLRMVHAKPLRDWAGTVGVRSWVAKLNLRVVCVIVVTVGFGTGAGRGVGVGV